LGITAEPTLTRINHVLLPPPPGDLPDWTELQAAVAQHAPKTLPFLLHIANTANIATDISPVVAECRAAMTPERMRNAQNAGVHLAAAMLLVRAAVGDEAAQQLQKWGMLHWLPEACDPLTPVPDTASLYR
jgi:hypothetical protein